VSDDLDFEAIAPIATGLAFSPLGGVAAAPPCCRAGAGPSVATAGTLLVDGLS